ncbi:hypothetical protein [Tunicatimonas pelagia]|uniref:hypothetical protein n=1 Tax=Tunicatimonas pelagia TaxID=931531 RepID=UPI002665F3DB|nr:hypothetical protein [Tunicatimonas pelagia]WKN41925.1 hypothetical protein P0M28_23060 [Tunicatimonas pelagia]
MPSPQSPELALNEIVSRLNHQMTGTLARLEGLYLLYKQEGQLRDELWEAAFQQAKQETFAELNRSFALDEPVYPSPLRVA